MTNTKMLKKAIKNSGLSVIFIAEKMGITRQTLYNRMNNKSEFLVSEIEILTQLLKLSRTERDEIFLR